MRRQLFLAVAMLVLVSHAASENDFKPPGRSFDGPPRANEPQYPIYDNYQSPGPWDLSPAGHGDHRPSEGEEFNCKTRTVLIEYINISVVNPDAPTVPGSTVVTKGTVRFDGQEVWGMGKATIMFLVDKNRWWQFSQGESFIGDDAVLLQGNVYVDNGKLTGRRALVGGIGKYAHATGYEDIEIDLATGNGKGYLKLTM